MVRTMGSPGLTLCFAPPQQAANFASLGFTSPRQLAVRVDSSLSLYGLTVVMLVTPLLAVRVRAVNTCYVSHGARTRSSGKWLTRVALGVRP